jgi:hypothetical protein
MEILMFLCIFNLIIHINLVRVMNNVVMTKSFSDISLRIYIYMVIIFSLFGLIYGLINLF